MKTENNTKYNLCPVCYNHPPEALLEEIGENVQQMPCFKCPSTSCTFAKGGSDKPVIPCPKCRMCNMSFKKNKNGKYFLGCLGFPQCKNIINVPESIKEVKVLSQTCHKCNANKVKVKFNDGELLPSNVSMRIHEDDSIFCFGANCDPDLESIGYQNNSTPMPLNSLNSTPQAKNTSNPLNQGQNSNSNNRAPGTSNLGIQMPNLNNQIRTSGSVQSILQKYSNISTNANLNMNTNSNSNSNSSNQYSINMNSGPRSAPHASLNQYTSLNRIPNYNQMQQATQSNLSSYDSAPGRLSILLN